MKAQLYTIDEIAAYLRVDSEAVVRLVEESQLRAYRVGEEYRISEAHVEEYLAAHEVSKGIRGQDMHVAAKVEAQLRNQPRPGTIISLEQAHQWTSNDWKEALWEFLNEPAIIDNMRQASDRGRPAAEVIAEELIDRFGREVKQDQVKQMIGRLIKQIMDQHGYDHVGRGERCRPNPVFSVASTYRRRH